MTEPIRWGILGAAKFARQQMGPAIHMARDNVLAALATSAPEKAEPFTSFAPGLAIHDSYDALLADPSIDAVYLPLPNHLHVEWTIRALEAGKHVLTEKPIALAESDFDRLIAARDAAGRLAAEGFMIVHHPQWQRAKELVETGALGQIVHVDGFFSYHNPDAANIRNRPETGGGGLRDIGVYIFGSARFVTGQEPTAIAARIRWENGVDVFAHVTGDFPGFTYNGVVSMRVAPAQRMVFYGTRAVMSVTMPFNANVMGQAELELSGPGLQTVTERWPGVNHYVHQVEAFGESIRTGAPYTCPLEFSRGTQRMMDMAFANATDLPPRTQG